MCRRGWGKRVSSRCGSLRLEPRFAIAQSRTGFLGGWFILWIGGSLWIRPQRKWRNCRSVFKGKARHRGRIRFDAFASQLVAERQWHPSQKINRLPGGESQLTMTLGSLEEIERWVLSWGGHARVLEPVELKRMIRRAAQAMLAEE